MKQHKENGTIKKIFPSGSNSEVTKNLNNKEFTQAEHHITGKTVLKAMNYLEDELIEDAGKTCNHPFLCQTSHLKQPEQNSSHTQISEPASVPSLKSHFTKAGLKWCAVAAALVLFLGGGVAVAAKYGIFRTEPGWESGYEVSITSRRVTEDEFSEEVLAVKQELLEDIAASKDREGQPFGWIRDFDSVEAAAAFIGHPQLKTPKTPGELLQTGVVVLGNDKAELLYVEFFARSTLEGFHYPIDMTESAVIYTTTMFPETGSGIKEDGLTYKDEAYLTKNGKEAMIVMPTEYWGNSGMEGYLVDDSVVYTLWLNCGKEDHDRAMQIMKEWLDQF